MPIPPSVVDGEIREEIAKLIEHRAWEFRHAPYEAGTYNEVDWEAALSKADAILALPALQSIQEEQGKQGLTASCTSGEARLGPQAANPTEGAYQSRVNDWMLACFGEGVTHDPVERSFRFLEEALELVQANGCSAAEAARLVEYVYGRPVGETAQEVGGVAVCLAALCTAAGIDMEAAAERELARVWTKVEKIRAKHASKPAGVRSSLPGLAIPADHNPSVLPATPPTDKARLDWLETHTVEVRDPLVYGSRHVFFASPDDSVEGEEGPSDIRAKIDRFLSSEAPPVISSEASSGKDTRDEHLSCFECDTALIGPICPKCSPLADAAESQLSALKGRVGELEEGLRPLAEFAKAILHDEDRKDDSIIVGKVIRDAAGDRHGRITFGDCRRVRDLLSSPVVGGSSSSGAESDGSPPQGAAKSEGPARAGGGPP